MRSISMSVEYKFKNCHPKILIQILFDHLLHFHQTRFKKVKKKCRVNFSSGIICIFFEQMFISIEEMTERI